MDNGDVIIDVDQGTIGTLDFRVYDSTMTLITPTVIDGNSIMFTNSDGQDARYYLSIGSTFPVSGPVHTRSTSTARPSRGPTDDHVNRGNWAATVLDVNSINGNASDTGIINTITDTDLFRYETIGRGGSYIRVSGDDPTPDFTVRIFDSNGNERPIWPTRPVWPAWSV